MNNLKGYVVSTFTIAGDLDADLFNIPTEITSLKEKALKTREEIKDRTLKILEKNQLSCVVREEDAGRFRSFITIDGDNFYQTIMIEYLEEKMPEDDSIEDNKVYVSVSEGMVDGAWATKPLDLEVLDFDNAKFDEEYFTEITETVEMLKSSAVKVY